MSTVMTDRIEKQVLLRAPRAGVWRALTHAAESGTSFGAKLEGPFAEGTTEAFRMNEGGWTGQARNIERHVAQA